MKFVFKFEKLLKIREFEKDKVENQLAKLQFELNKEQQKLKDLYLMLREYNLKLENSLKGNLNINEINSVRYYLEKIDKEIDIQKKIIIQINNEVSTKKKQLIRAVQKVKILEKLREKKYESYLKKMDYIESNVLDEIGTNQYYRKSKIC